MIDPDDPLCRAVVHGRAPRLIDAATEQAIATRGYAVVRLVPEADALAIGDEIARRFPAGVAANQPGSNWYLGLLDADRAQAVATAQLVWDALVPPLGALMTEACCHYASVAIKPGGADATPLHQHWPTTADPFARRIGCWALLSDSDGQAATFRVVPGSHQLLPFIRHHGGSDYFAGFSDTIDRDHGTQVVVRPGEAVLFEDSILHATGANRSTAMRIAGIASMVGSAMRTAAILPAGDDRFDVVDTDRSDGMARYLETGEWPDRWRVVATIPNRNRAIDAAEFRALLAGGRKASLDLDPLDRVRDAAHRASRPLRRLAARLGISRSSGRA